MNQLDFFNKLKGNLRHAKRDVPSTSMVVLGFTQGQMLKMDLKKPRLIWFDSATKTFFDQGDSTKIKKSDWTKVDQVTFKKDKPMKDLAYYVMINSGLVADSNTVVYEKK